jgi:hypothetical protein
MRRALRNALAQPEHALLAVDISSPTVNVQTVTLLIHGYEQLHECKMLIPYLNSSSDSAKASALGEKLITAVFDHAYKYDPLQRTVAGHLLQLALNLDVPVKTLLKFLLVRSPPLQQAQLLLLCIIYYYYYSFFFIKHNCLYATGQNGCAGDRDRGWRSDA